VRFGACNAYQDRESFMTHSFKRATGVDRRAQMEAALAEYPHLSEDRLAALIAWVVRDASARDLSILASNEALAEPYRRFRADHIDTLTGKDIAKALGMAALLAAVTCSVVWRAA
jgi:hypothetical protein